MRSWLRAIPTISSASRRTSPAFPSFPSERRSERGSRRVSATCSALAEDLRSDLAGLLLLGHVVRVDASILRRQEARYRGADHVHAQRPICPASLREDARRHGAPDAESNVGGIEALVADRDEALGALEAERDQDALGLLEISSDPLQRPLHGAASTARSLDEDEQRVPGRLS